MSMPKVFDLQLNDSNSKIVEAIEHAQNNIQYTLDGVFDFMNNRKRKDYSPMYHVFKEYFVMCWSDKRKL